MLLISCGAAPSACLAAQDCGMRWPASLRSWNDGFFCASEGDCTSEKGAGQFSIFGAIEEKEWPLIFAEERRSEKLKRVLGRCFTAVVWIAAWRGGRNSGVGRCGIVHRGCTGNAERARGRKAVGSGQWAVITDQWRDGRRRPSHMFLWAVWQITDLPSLALGLSCRI